jgi:hypothetical protein
MKRSQKLKNCIVLIVGGLAIAAYSNMGLFKAKASASWLATKGEILSSEVKRSMVNRNSRLFNRCVFRANYKYEIDGKNYTSDKVSFLSKYISREKRADFKNKYAPGKIVDVFYNPDLPSEATLIRGVNKYNKNPFSIFGLMCSGIGILAGIVVGVNYLRQGDG